jgi:hypothetical protein
VISLNLVLAGLRLGLKNRQVGEKWVSDDCSYLFHTAYANSISGLSSYHDCFTQSNGNNNFITYFKCAGLDKSATYVSTASNANTLVFSYTIASGDMTTTGITATTTALSLNTGRNRNNHQKPTFHPLGDFLNPALALLGQGLKKSPIGKKLTYVSTASNANTLVFSYTIASGDMTTTGITATATALSLNTGSIKDTAGNAIQLATPAVASSANTITVDAKAPNAVDLDSATDVQSTSKALFPRSEIAVGVAFDDRLC